MGRSKLLLGARQVLAGLHRQKLAEGGVSEAYLGLPEVSDSVELDAEDFIQPAGDVAAQALLVAEIQGLDVESVDALQVQVAQVQVVGVGDRAVTEPPALQDHCIVQVEDFRDPPLFALVVEAIFGPDGGCGDALECSSDGVVFAAAVLAHLRWHDQSHPDAESVKGT